MIKKGNILKVSIMSGWYPQKGTTLSSVHMRTETDGNNGAQFKGIGMPYIYVT